MSDPSSHTEYLRLIEAFESIRNDMLRLVEDSADLMKDVHPEHQLSARNLLHYLALRSRDLRPLRLRLAAVGLSSLGRAESHVFAAVEAVLHALRHLASSDDGIVPPSPGGIDLATGQQLLDAHTEAVFGARPDRRGVRRAMWCETDTRSR